MADLRKQTSSLRPARSQIGEVGDLILDHLRRRNMTSAGIVDAMAEAGWAGQKCSARIHDLRAEGWNITGHGTKNNPYDLGWPERAAAPARPVAQILVRIMADGTVAAEAQSTACTDPLRARGTAARIASWLRGVEATKATLVVRDARGEEYTADVEIDEFAFGVPAECGYLAAEAVEAYTDLDLYYSVS